MEINNRFQPHNNYLRSKSNNSEIKTKKSINKTNLIAHQLEIEKNSTQILNGIEKKVHPNGVEEIGKWEKGVRNGKFTIKDPKIGTIFMNLINDIPEGPYAKKFNSGYEEKGYFCHGKKNGTSETKLKDGSIMIENWKMGVRDGIVTQKTIDERVYRSRFSNGKLLESAIFFPQTSQLEKYIGEHVNGKPHGRGKMYFRNGEIMEGTWTKNDFPTKEKGGTAISVAIDPKKNSNIIHIEDDYEQLNHKEIEFFSETSLNDLSNNFLDNIMTSLEERLQNRSFNSKLVSEEKTEKMEDGIQEEKSESNKIADSSTSINPSPIFLSESYNDPLCDPFSDFDNSLDDPCFDNYPF